MSKHQNHRAITVVSINSTTAYKMEKQMKKTLLLLDDRLSFPLIKTVTSTFPEIQSEQKLKKADDVLPFLTKTERKVFQLILLGKTNRQISEELSVGLHSVENYTYSIYEKLACPRNREELQARFD